jgi:predicted transposase YbfD/YdcC
VGKLPAPPCATAEEEELNNRSRHEIRSLRWVSTTPETLCCVGARSVVEVTREVTILGGKDKGKHTFERVFYLSSLEMQPGQARALLNRIREYWGIEGGLHQRLDVTAGEDSSRVRNRNALLVLGIVRRSTIALSFAGETLEKTDDSQPSGTFTTP